MKILFLNTFNNFSTGNIVNQLSEYLKSKGHQTICLYGRCKNTFNNNTYIGTNTFLNKIENFFVYLSGKIGHFHSIETSRIIKILKQEKPDIIHIHNLHGNYVNFRKLFLFIKKTKIKVFITTHDFWFGTGRCAHPRDCINWKNGCGNCLYKNYYPKTFVLDKSKNLFFEKQKLISLVKPVFISPSNWLKNLLEISPITKECKILKISNGVDSNIFFLKDSKAINSKKIVLLGLASRWNEAKGIQVFNKLASDLNPDLFEIHIVGVTKKDDIHKKIIKHELTKDKIAIAKYYQMADIFINPTTIDTFPTTNIESLLCGTPVFVYNVGGAAEAINDTNGKIIKAGDYNSLLHEINNFKRENYSSKLIAKEALKYSKQNMLLEYERNYLK